VVSGVLNESQLCLRAIMIKNHMQPVRNISIVE